MADLATLVEKVGLAGAIALIAVMALVATVVRLQRENSRANELLVRAVRRVPPKRIRKPKRSKGR